MNRFSGEALFAGWRPRTGSTELMWARVYVRHCGVCRVLGGQTALLFEEGAVGAIVSLMLIAGAAALHAGGL
jgi:hypothetical protein